MITVRLRVYDCDGLVATATQVVSIEGENKVGITHLDFVDMHIGFSGVPIEVRRTYDSRWRSQQGDYGWGWRLDMGVGGRTTRNRKPGAGWTMECPLSPLFGQTWVAETTTHVVQVWINEKESYRFKPVVSTSTVSYGGSGFCTGKLWFQQIGGRPGAKLSLVQGDDFAWLNDGTDSLYEPGLAYVLDVDDVQLTTPDGRAVNIDRSVGVYYIADAYGNAVTLGSGGITHSNGQSLSFARDAAGRVQSITDPVGQQITFAYDTAGDLINVTDRVGATTSFFYGQGHQMERFIDGSGRTVKRMEVDAAGRVTKTFDGNQSPESTAYDASDNSATFTTPTGQTTLGWNDEGLLDFWSEPSGATSQYEYDTNGNTTKSIDPLGNVTSYAYDQEWQVTSVTDPNQHATTWVHTYDANGAIVRTVKTDALGRTTTTDFGPGKQPTAMVHPSGLVETFEYDTAGRITNHVIQNGASAVTLTFEHDALGRVTMMTDVLGRTMSFEHDGLGKETKRTWQWTPAGGTGPVTLEQTYEYDAEGRRTRQTDPLGGSTLTAYDEAGRTTGQRNALGIWTLFVYDQTGHPTQGTLASQPGFPNGASWYKQYDERGQIHTAIGRDGAVVGWEYDASGRKTREIRADGSSSTFGYDAAGRQTSVQEAGGTTTFEHDAVGNVTRIVDPAGQPTLQVYDAANQRVMVKDALGHDTYFEYDAGGRMTKVQYADGTSILNSYDPLGLLVSHTDELGQSTTYVRNAIGKVLSHTDGAGRTTSFAYDEMGALTAMTDANMRVNAWEYDAAGRLTRYVRPSGAASTATYDAVGKRLTQTDFAGNTTTFTYDAWGRLLSKALPGGQAVTFAYSAGDRLTSMHDATGTTSYTYDVAGRLLSIATPVGTVSYGYDADGRPESLTSGAGTVSYGYDVRGNMTRVLNALGEQTTYEHDALGRRTAVVLPTGLRTMTTFDVRNRPTLIVHEDAAALPLLALAYSYDAAGRRTQLLESGVFGAATIAYARDAAGQVTLETRTTGNGTTQIAYGYDLVGNRTLRSDGVTSAVYQYDIDDELVAVNGVMFSYDQNGNMTKRTDSSGDTLYTYDSEDRLVSVQAPNGSTADYAYNGHGLRRSSTVDGSETQYLLDERSATPQVLEERTGAGVPVASYTYGPGRISRYDGASASYYHGDVMGSARFTTDGAGAVGGSQTYDAFGRALATSGTMAGPFGYAGEQTDPETGLQYLRARYYDPDLGRFLSRDTLAVDPERVGTWHRYAYVGNDPVTFVDPTGHYAATANELDKGGGATAGASLPAPPKAAVVLLKAAARVSARAVAQTSSGSRSDEEEQCEDDEMEVFRFVRDDVTKDYLSPLQLTINAGQAGAEFREIVWRRILQDALSQADPYTLGTAGRHILGSNSYAFSPFVATTNDPVQFTLLGIEHPQLGTQGIIYGAKYVAWLCVPNSRTYTVPTIRQYFDSGMIGPHTPVAGYTGLGEATIARIKEVLVSAQQEGEVLVLPREQREGIQPWRRDRFDNPNYEPTQ